MKQHLFIFMSVAAVAQAAQSSLVTTHFIQEADIATSVTRKSMKIGFAAGCVHQFAIFGAATAYALVSRGDSKGAAFGLIAQWPMCALFSIMAHDVYSNKIRYLTQLEDMASEWLHDEIMGNGDIVSQHKFLQQYKQLRSGSAVSEQACESKKIYAAYNRMLECFVTRRAFVKGYIAASVLGPLPSIGIAYTLIKLGLMR
jgi:hypothetical protein